MIINQNTMTMVFFSLCISLQRIRSPQKKIRTLTPEPISIKHKFIEQSHKQDIKATKHIAQLLLLFLTRCHLQLPCAAAWNNIAPLLEPHLGIWSQSCGILCNKYMHDKLLPVLGQYYSKDFATRHIGTCN